MKLLTYVLNNEDRLGILKDDLIYDVKKLAEQCNVKGDFSSLKSVLENNLLGTVKNLENRINSEIKYEILVAEAELKAPIPNPDKILGAALNYKDFCERGNLPIPEKLKVFSKFATTVNNPNGSIDIKGNNVTYEGELGVVIGKTGKDIHESQAMEYVAGYTVVNDCTANNLIKEDVQLFRGKNLDGFLPMGPIFVTKDEIPNYKEIEIETYVDDELRQKSLVENIIFDIPYQIALFSRILTLSPGDIIATGTPAGTATQFSPPKFLQEGQVVSITLRGIGTLKNTVISNI